jgi:leucyl-tRNA synthetase
MAADKAALEQLARATIESNLEGKQIVKTIVVPGRLVNFVVK